MQNWKDYPRIMMLKPFEGKNRTNYNFINYNL